MKALTFRLVATLLALVAVATVITNPVEATLPDTFKRVVGTQWSFADHAGDFAPTAANDLEQGTPTDVDLTLASLGAGAARQSDKFDFGANRDTLFNISAAIEYATAPAAGGTETVDFYLAFSPDATAGNGNPGGVGGVDAAYTGYSSNLSDSLNQVTYLCSMPLTVQATTTVQVSTNICTFPAAQRYATLIVVNNSAADAFHTDDVEMHIVIEPISTQVQE